MIKPLDCTNYSKSTPWCGPSALALLTGIPLRDATEQLTRIHGSSYEELSGVWPEDVIIALGELGYRSTPIDIMARYPGTEYGPTLARYMRERQPDQIFQTCLVELAGHFIVTHWGFAGDNWTKEMVPFDRFPKPRRLVKAAWAVTREPS